MRINFQKQSYPLIYDHWISIASEMEQKGRWDFAARVYNYTASLYGNVQSCKLKEANALYSYGAYQDALDAIGEIIRPTISYYLIRARVLNALDDVEGAILNYEMAVNILER